MSKYSDVVVFSLLILATVTEKRHGKIRLHHRLPNVAENVCLSFFPRHVSPELLNKMARGLGYLEQLVSRVHEAAATA
jgi:hypothetical protein